MIYLLDTANPELIRKAHEIYPLAGVTTNPTIIAREKNEFLKIIQAIRAVIGAERMLHVQVVGREAERMAREAEYLAGSVGGDLYIKIPVTPEGLKAIKLLKPRGFKLTATAVFTPQQALLAAVAGADFVAPYVNRLDNSGGDGAQVVAAIRKLFDSYGLPTRILAASFKNARQVHEAALSGAHAVTVNPETLDALLQHPLTDWSVEQFIRDWEGVYAKGKCTDEVK
ncbi:fructose-6-phosphate aldolase 2 [Hydrogenispora ethanolica]|uniref:Fructose-6-phosphate aldolase 2 n=1 Tax=Hydrogenispora ethanolica TaxID=1082276 RepID=A0A4R1RBF6_HYDET|nr:fructose-6-phosphate aldolase [Hydrogenispora ethanolica]TCL62792.1 fructose-6-phosphate aldolase 2 [Hydrogenispora ethanolica]